MVSYAPQSRQLCVVSKLTLSWPVCALQYASITEILLALSTPNQESENRNQTSDLVRKLTIRVCGIAYTNENVPAMINSFGPLLFCMFLLFDYLLCLQVTLTHCYVLGGRYLTLKSHRRLLEAMLIRFAQPTGYPIEYNIEQLKEWWAQSEHRDEI